MKISAQWGTFGRYRALESSSGGFTFQFGELVKCPTRDQKEPGSIQAKVIFKMGKRGRPGRKRYLGRILRTICLSRA